MERAGIQTSFQGQKISTQAPTGEKHTASVKTGGNCGSEMAAENPATFCPRCLCPACVAHSRLLWENQQAELAEQAEREAVLRERREREEERHRELLQQSAIIWMLVNHAADAGEVKHIINTIAWALDLSPTVVNARRNIYVMELNERAEIFSQFQWKPPGTRGMEEPDWCETCGGLKTKGRKCRRRSCR